MGYSGWPGVFRGWLHPCSYTKSLSHPEGTCPWFKCSVVTSLNFNSEQGLTFTLHSKSYILNMDETKFVDGWMWSVKGREALEPRLLVSVTASWDATEWSVIGKAEKDWGPRKKMGWGESENGGRVKMWGGEDGEERVFSGTWSHLGPTQS